MRDLLAFCLLASLIVFAAALWATGALTSTIEGTEP